ncbi:MAG: PDZ domain-containing protein [Phycisphaerales bacterium]|nr:MAG: PDZ domain-containing protein [Phycisphaerales bacterium]
MTMSKTLTSVFTWIVFAWAAASPARAEEYKADGRSQTPSGASGFVTGFVSTGDGAVFSGAATDAQGTWSTAMAAPFYGGVTVTTDGSGTGRTKVWMGVNLVETSEALEAQLQLEGGAVVVNVVKDSPAQRAGLQRFDVITAVDDRKIEGAAADVAEVLSKYAAGQTVRLSVVRQAAPMTINVTLAERPAQALDWVFDFAPDALVQDNTTIRGRMLRRDDQGHWQLEDFGDLDPKGWVQFFPNQDTFYSSIYINNDKKSVRVQTDVNGTTLIVEEKEDGSISVKRTAPNGDSSETVYEDRNHLKAEDAEAFELLTRSSVQTAPFGAHGFSFGPGGARVFKDEELSKHIQEAQESVREAFKNFQWWKGGRAMSIPDAEDMAEQLKNQDFPNVFQWYHALPNGASGKPVYSFRELDGSAIEVRIRKGDSEIVRQFSSEADMQQRAPDLYERYRNVEAAD